jgi:N-acetylglutamate synthase-like GNAT family acetyltransferase
LEEVHIQLLIRFNAFELLLANRRSQVEENVDITHQLDLHAFQFFGCINLLRHPDDQLLDFIALVVREPQVKRLLARENHRESS